MSQLHVCAHTQNTTEPNISLKKDGLPQAPLCPAHAHLDQLVEGLIDEDEGDEEGKDLLGESGDKADQEAPLQSHHEQGQEHQPEANPHSAHQVLQLVAAAELNGRGGGPLGVTGAVSRKGSEAGQKELLPRRRPPQRPAEAQRSRSPAVAEPPAGRRSHPGVLWT